jgi:23S rRNA-/tRNA-specific pseudouridylate synthase
MYPYQNYGYQPNYQQPNYMQRQYAPQPSQMPQNQQQAFPPIQTPPPMETPIQDIKFVNRAQAEAYIVFPNTKVMLIDKESGLVMREKEE